MSVLNVSRIIRGKKNVRPVNLKKVSHFRSRPLMKQLAIKEREAINEIHLLVGGGIATALMILVDLL